ncbi:MAG: peptide deformylase [Burkholderiaceae bacterium]|nr:peptide deformylase [Burkholderiaceae bacterium]
MSIRPILKMGDLRLLRRAEQVRKFDTPELHELIADMFETMAAADGAGLAAPQIGINLQLVILGFNQNGRYPDAEAIPETVLINPLITPIGDEVEEAWEGCLSVPGMRGMVPRWAKLRYEAFDQYGNKISQEVDGFHARVVQHECDHLGGILYPMRMRDLMRFGFNDALFPWVDHGQEERG